MFTNVGKKIKTVVRIFCILEMIGAVVYGCSMMGNSYTLSIGITIAIAGPISAWIVNTFLYGFGEMVENSDIQTELAVKAEMEKQAKEKETEKAE